MTSLPQVTMNSCTLKEVPCFGLLLGLEFKLDRKWNSPSNDALRLQKIRPKMKYSKHPWATVAQSSLFNLDRVQKPLQSCRGCSHSTPRKPNER